MSHIKFETKKGDSYTMPTEAIALCADSGDFQVGNVNVVDTWISVEEQEYKRIEGILLGSPMGRPEPLLPSPGSDFSGRTI